MSSFKRAAVGGGPPRSSLLVPFEPTQMMILDPVLPAELLASVLDHLPVPDLLRFAQVSRRMRDLVYNDSRWMQRLSCMGCWNETEALERAQAPVNRNVQRHPASPQDRPPLGAVAAGRNSVTIYDASLEEKKRQSGEAMARQHQEQLSKGFSTLNLSNTPKKRLDPAVRLTILEGVKPVRGFARLEYARVYQALAPFYLNIVQSSSYGELLVFQVYQEPLQQAEILSQLKRFAKSDFACGWQDRASEVESVMRLFEAAALREFEQGVDRNDVGGRMQKYANVLVILNGGHAAINAFISRSPIMTHKERLGDPMAALNEASFGSIKFVKIRQFFASLATSLNEQSTIAQTVFPPSVDIMIPFLERIAQDVISDYVTVLVDEAHERNVESYLKAVSGLYEQCINLLRSLQKTTMSRPSFYDDAKVIYGRIFEPHIDLYLQEELDFFKNTANSEVTAWENLLTEQDATTESFYMSNFNRQADKKDFLTSFKKVVMMPVNALPSLPSRASVIGTTKPIAPSKLDAANIQSSSRPGTPRLPSDRPLSLPNLESQVAAAPTTELAAKAALMNSRLEGIRSLFSIEIALNMIHNAKASLERASVFLDMGSRIGEEAKEQCAAIFVSLLQILGTRHIKAGFDKAVDHLSRYNPREVSEHNAPGVAPLVMFLELVNVGDLIQQMVDVFYEQQLVANKLADRNDFLDPAGREKKRFEQMLDERVAAGLNKGIDVLMDEVEYLCATTQLNTDFNPGASGEADTQVFDVGPTETAKRIVEMVSSHTKMLVGSTEKNMLDVFNQEVGLRLFGVLCKHLKRQRISVDGAIKLISDMNLYYNYIQTLKNKDLLQYFKALRELAQIYLIDPSHSKDLAVIIADGERFDGIFGAEEVYEFAQRRADWFQVRKAVENQMYGIGCAVM